MLANFLEDHILEYLKMSDFPARQFKWTEILTLILEHKTEGRNKVIDLEKLREYACQKYKANPEIENKFLHYFYMEAGQLSLFEILVLMFGEP